MGSDWTEVQPEAGVTAAAGRVGRGRDDFMEEASEQIWRTLVSGHLGAEVPK